MATYKAVIIGLTGIGAQRPEATTQESPYGRIPQSHAAAYQAHPQTDVVAVCDIRPEMLDKFRQTWQDVWPTMQYYTDYRAMLAETKPDIVSVVTPDHLHADITVAAANSGAKAIFCEKPIATTLADADRMIAACDAAGVRLSVLLQRRAEPLFRQVYEAIRTGDLGEITMASVCMPYHRPQAYYDQAAWSPVASQGRPSSFSAMSDSCAKLAEQRWSNDSNQFADRFPMIDQILRTPRLIGNRRVAHVDAQSVIKRGEHFLIVDRAELRDFAQTIRGADDLPHPHPATR